MGLLIFAYRKQDIISRKNQMEFKLLQLTAKLRDLQSYSASIADGAVSMNDLMNAPASVFNRMSMYMLHSHQASLSGAQQKYQFMSMTPGAMPQLQDPNQQAAYSQMMFKNLYDQERERFKKIEEKMLNEQEKRITQESEKLQSQLKLLEGELGEVKKAEDNAAKDSAPKFGLG